MARFILCHEHAPSECRFAFAAWKGFESPLRRQHALGSCALGGHALWWTVDADDEATALSQLPPYLAVRTRVDKVSEVQIP